MSRTTVSVTAEINLHAVIRALEEHARSTDIWGNGAWIGREDIKRLEEATASLKRKVEAGCQPSLR